MHSQVNKTAERILDWLLPPSCTLCGSRGEFGLPLCAGCWQDLPRLKHACRRCAEPLPQDGLCGRCLRRAPPQDLAHGAFLYADPVDRLVQRLKFGGRLGTARLAGALLAAAARSAQWERPQLLIPVPLHRARLRQRGYDQAQAIAAECGRRLGIPMDSRACQRKSATAPQPGLSRAERRRNLRGAFVVVTPPQARHVAVIDDVMTTGATAGELAAALKRGGVERVDVWALCRAGPDR
ncbi:MAG: ComF family protein [Immundisolibacter sp.]|uniref:ComF family protein n=1 Tax=Immundisolibacter sp. TaxID=1934948 RepID=UPI003EDF646F